MLAFLELNGLKRIVRAHEYTGTGCRVVNLGNGYEAVTGMYCCMLSTIVRCLTHGLPAVFSASDYMKQSNPAAVLFLAGDGSMTHQVGTTIGWRRADMTH